MSQTYYQFTDLAILPLISVEKILAYKYFCYIQIFLT